VLEQRIYVGQLTVFEEHTSGTPLYTLWSWYTPRKFWFTLGCTMHPVDKHWTTRLTDLFEPLNSSLEQTAEELWCW